jgi:hypothetical protein
LTSQGTAHGRFTRAIKQGNLFAAELAARELRGLSLNDALDLVALIARVRPDRLDSVAIRWHGRLEVEARSLMLAESRLALPTLSGTTRSRRGGARRAEISSETPLPRRGA